MNIKIQARAHLEGKRIDLDWVWRPSDREPVRFRLLRRQHRYPVAPHDGVCVLDMRADAGVASGNGGVLAIKDDPDSGERICCFSIADAGLAEGIYYYTLFAGDDHSAATVSRTCAAAGGSFGFDAQLYGLLPAVYRAYDEPSPGDRGQGELRRFLAVCGAALDYMRSRAEGLRDIQDVLQTRADFLPHLARWIGWDLDLNQDEISQRMEILFAPELYRTVGTLPNLAALVNRVTGWDCRIKEFVHNVCLSNAPEKMHQWDIWEVARNTAGNRWLTPKQRTMAGDYHGSPACVRDGSGASWLFWQAGQKAGTGIWCQKLDDPGDAPRRVALYPEGEPDCLLPGAGAPAVILSGRELWLFFASGQPGRREVWYAPNLLPGSLDKTAAGPAVTGQARNLSLHAADDANPAAVVFGEQVWVFWQSNRRGPTDIWARVYEDGQWGPPQRITTAGFRHRNPAVVVDANHLLWLFYCEEYNSRQGLCSRLRCRTFDGREWREAADAGTEGPDDEAPAAIILEGHIWLFWQARDDKGHWQISSKTWNGKKWGKSAQVAAHPAADKEPAALVDVNGRLRVFWRSQRRGYFRMEGQAQGKGYPVQSCTVDTRNELMLEHVRLQKEAFENQVHYTYDTRVCRPDQAGSNDGAWCARDTVGVYLTPDTLDAALIARGRELVKGLIQRFVPLQTRILFIIEPPVVSEKVYTYDFPDDLPQTYIGEQYEFMLERAEQYDGPGEDYTDTLPDWIWLCAWNQSCREHRTVDVQVDPVVTRYRTWQGGLISGGKK